MRRVGLRATRRWRSDGDRGLPRPRATTVTTGPRLMCVCKCGDGRLYGRPGEEAECDRRCGWRAILHRETERGTVELSWIDRLRLIQSDRWFDNEALHTSSVYSKELCCYCARPVRPDAARLRTARTNDGEWWLVSVDEDMTAPEWHDFQDQLDGTFAHTLLPVGPDCLRRHPAWRVAVVAPEGARR